MTLIPPPAPAPAVAEVRDPRAVLMMLNAGAIIVAALYFGQELLVPLALAAMLAFVLAPASAMLQRLWLPRGIAVLIAVVLAFVVIGGIGLVVGRQLGLLADNLPTYEATVLAKWHALTQGSGIVAQITASVPVGSAGDGAILGIDPSTGIALARKFAPTVLGPLGTAFIVLVFTIFMLLASDDLRDRLVRLVGRRDMHRTILAMNEAARRLSRYFLFQLSLNSSFGVLIGVSLWIAGLPNPVLWGILAACMRFVPYVGTVIALVPPLLLATAVVPGWELALVVGALFLGCELIMGQVVEPLIYGHSTGLSPIAVIVATAFWALLWGPVGLLLATPLTVCLVVIGRNVEALAFLDVILGDSSPLEAAETFYQRALEGQVTTLVAGARQQIAAASLTDYYDRVALPGLALAQGDLSRDEAAFERLEAIHAQVELFLRLIDRSTPQSDDLVVAPAWRAPGAVACIPGRGQLDDLAAAMAVQVLGGAGFGALMVPNQVLGASGDLPPGVEGTLLCCLSVLEDGSNVSGIRYLVRRIEKRMPGAVVVICLWHAERDSPTLTELRADEHGKHVVLSAGELLAYTQTLVTRISRAAPIPVEGNVA
jgi:predicted PurR-regulated permease PerM